MNQLGRMALAAASLAGAGAAAAQEDFGRFEGDPVGRRFSDGPCVFFELGAPFTFHAPAALDWTVPADRVVNGADIPPIFFGLVGRPYDPDVFPASVVHDHYVVTRERTSAETHEAFWLALRAKGVSATRARAMFWAVVFSNPDWDVGVPGDRPLVCNPRLMVAGLNAQAAPPPPVPRVEVDFADPAQATAALAKLTAVMRMLETTDGTIVDVLSTGPVPSDTESLIAHATYMRGLVANVGRAEVRDFGLGASWLGVGPEDVPVWPNGVPDYEALVGFTELEERTAGEPVRAAFLLRPEDLAALAEEQGLGDVVFLGPVPEPSPAAASPPAAADP